MRTSPILLLHICAGTIGFLSGAGAAFLRKGSRRHSIAGEVFGISMLTLGATGAYLAILKFQPGNILGGTLTCYLVATAWIAARRAEAETSIFDWAALLVALGITAVELTWGLQAAMSPTGRKFDYPPGPYFIMGSVSALAALGDLRMLLRHGILGTKRIARHLWRMNFAWFIASASIFSARQHLFPAILRKTGVLVFLSFLPLLLLIFWLIRVRLANAYKRAPMPRGAGVYPLAT